MNLQMFIDFATMALRTFLNLGHVFNIPIRLAAGRYLPKVVDHTISLLDLLGQSWIGDSSVYELLFSGTTITLIIFLGIVKWLLNIIK